MADDDTGYSYDLPFTLYDPDVPEVRVKRPVCTTCSRPVTVCVCHAINKTFPPVKTEVVVLQHPAEENRQLRTVPLLQAGLSREKCKVIVGKRFRNISSIVSSSAALLFPGKDAVDCEHVPPGTYDTLVCIDGTWPQARRIYQKSPELHALPKVMLSTARASVYLIHTQPTVLHLSTLESVARAIELLDQIPGLEEQLIAPLKEMVRIQFKFGSCAHRTQEEARKLRKDEIKKGMIKNLTISPRDHTFDYDSF